MINRIKKKLLRRTILLTLVPVMSTIVFIYVVFVYVPCSALWGAVKDIKEQLAFKNIKDFWAEVYSSVKGAW